MARLPSDADLGERPNPTGARPIASYTPARAEVAEANAAQQTARSAQAGMQVAEKMLAAQARITSQQEAVERARDFTKFNELATAEMNRLTTEGDFSSIDTTKQYGKFLTDNYNKLINEHKGSDESKAALAARIEGSRFSFANQAAQLGVKAQQKLVESTIGNQVNSLASKVYDDPTNLASAWQSVDKAIADFGPAIAPDQEAAYTSNARRMLAVSAVNSFMDRGAYADAKDIMDSTPGIREVMTPDDYNKLNGRISAAEKSARDEQTKGFREREALEQFLGRKTTLAERVGMKFGKKDKTLADTKEEYETVLGRPLRQDELMQVLKLNPQQARTDAGKAVQDRQMFVDQYGENSPQVKSFDEANLSNPAKLSDVSAIRAQFTNLSKDFVTTRDSMNKITAMAKDDSGASDMSLIFNYMKMLDPASTVKEGEYASAEKTTGIPGRLTNLYNKAIDGAFLNPEQRTEFVKAASTIFQSQLSNHLSLENQYRGIAQRNKLTPEDVVIDFVGPYRAQAEAAGKEKPADQPASGEAPATPSAPVIHYGLDGKRLGAK